MKEQNLLKITGQAIQDYQMINDKDTVWVALSGAPKSLTALIFLLKRLSFVPISYTLRPIHILLPEENETKVRTWYATLQSMYHLPELFLSPLQDSLYSLYRICPRNAILRTLFTKVMLSPSKSKLVLGDNLEDIVLSGLAALFYHNRFSLLLPHFPLTKYPIDIIRPLAYLSTKRLLAYCEQHHLPLLRPSRPHEIGKQKINSLFQDFHKLVSDPFQQIFAAFRKPQQRYFLD